MGTPDVPVEIMASYREELAQILAGHTVATLRDIARAWGWPVKGTAKNDIIEQVCGYLMDVPRMRAIYDSLAETQQAILQWINSVEVPNNYRELAAALSYVVNREVSGTEYKEAVERMQARGLLFTDQVGRSFVPSVYTLWMPILEPERLRHEGQLVAGPSFDIGHINAVTYRLLTQVESDRLQIPPAPAPGLISPGSSGVPFAKRPGLVRGETLQTWGFTTPAERDEARFMLELLVLGQIMKISGAGNTARLTVDPAARAGWDAELPHVRVSLLRSWWIVASLQGAAPPVMTWNELDLAVPAIEGYTLRFSVPWMDPFSASRPVDHLRYWVASLLSRLATDRWFDLEAFLQLSYHLFPNALPSTGYGQWQWYEGGKLLNSTTMTWPTWRATNGRIIEAVLTGPAQWLGMVEVAYRERKPAGFRIAQKGAVEDVPLTPDLLQFQPPDTFRLQNVWQAGPIHALLREIAEESGRDRAYIDYRLSAPVFRSSLDRGMTVDKLAAAFAEKSVPLAPTIVARLKEWEARAGRYRLHEKVAVIEFGEDMPAAEIQAIARLGGEWLYQAAPRCLVALEPDRVPGLVADLRRRGYTPQVIS